MRFSVAFVVVTLLAQCSQSPNSDQATGSIIEASALRDTLKRLHYALSTPGPDDWLAQHEEKGQTFDEYLVAEPIRPTQTRNKLYIQKLGTLEAAEEKVIELTAEYLSIFYQMPVKILDPIPLDTSMVPSGSRRPMLDHQQYHTKYILYDILKPNLPDSAAAYIAFTAEDLYPDPRWNFVFGQASVKDRVGVWSIHRYGIPSAGETAFREVLFRAMKVASHETGHMFTMRHCIDYECNMNGSNSLNESDRKPPYLCPECIAKLSWNLDLDEVKRFNEIDDFFGNHAVSPYYRNYYQSAIELLDSNITQSRSRQ